MEDRVVSLWWTRKSAEFWDAPQRKPTRSLPVSNFFLIPTLACFFCNHTFSPEEFHILMLQIVKR